MRCGWLIIFAGLSLVSPCQGQAPGTVERRDIDGDYRRPDLKAPLFDAAALPLSDTEVEAVMQELRLIVRNFPSGVQVDHRMRSHALGIALRLRPDDRSCVVANGQLARGFTPAPVPADQTPVPEGTARRLMTLAAPMLLRPEPSARELAGLLLDLATRLDRSLRRQVVQMTYGWQPAWPEGLPANDLADLRPSFALRETAVSFCSPAMDEEPVAVQAVAHPRPGQKGLKLVLPAGLRRQIKENAALREETVRRVAVLRKTLRERHQRLPEGWRVEFSAARAGELSAGQWFAGMTLAMEALLEGVKPPADCLVGTGLNEQGEFYSAVTVERILPALAARPAKGQVLLAPGAAEQVEDWVLLNPAQWKSLCQTALHRAGSVADAMILLRPDRAPKLQQALDLFAATAARVLAASDPLAELRRPETAGQLKEVLTWHPQHLSAAILYNISTAARTTLSVRGSLAHIDDIARSLLSTDRNLYPLHLPRPAFGKTVFRREADALEAARARLHPEARYYAAELYRLGRLLDTSTGQWSQYRSGGLPDPPAATELRNRLTELRKQLEAGLSKKDGI